MNIFEMMAGIGIIGFGLSFATTMYLQNLDSKENKIANFGTFFFLILLTIGIIGYML